jgi:hypothetical protein
LLIVICQRKELTQQCYLVLSKQARAMTSSERRGPIAIACVAAVAVLIASGKPARAAGQLPDSGGSSTTTPKAEESRASATEISDSLWYLRLGAGGVIASGLKGGPAFGTGFRYNWSSYGIDASIFDFILTEHGSSFDNPAGSWLKIALLSYADPFGSSSLYYGGGIGWGTTQANIDGVPFSNFGIDIGLTAGLELHRASALRYFVQLDGDLPTYAAHGLVPGYESLTPTFTKESRYMPSFSLSLGIAFGTPRVIATVPAPTN